MTSRVREFVQTGLREPVLLAAWPGMGHVALQAFAFLQESLGAEHLGVLEEPEFFQLPGAVIEKGLVQSARVPQSSFSSWRRGSGPSDLLFFIGERQPVPGKELPLAQTVLEFARKHGVSRVVTAAAMPTSINHYQPSRVWVTATHRDVLREVSPFCHRVLEDGQISGMNGLLLAVAKRKTMKGFCLLGEIPFYTTAVENPKASMAVLQTLTRVLDLQVDLSGLRELAVRTEKEVDRYLLELQSQKEEEKKPTDSEGPTTVH